MVSLHLEGCLWWSQFLFTWNPSTVINIKAVMFKPGQNYEGCKLLTSSHLWLSSLPLHNFCSISRFYQTISVTHCTEKRENLYQEILNRDYCSYKSNGNKSREPLKLCALICMHLHLCIFFFYWKNCPVSSVGKREFLGRNSARI